MRQYFIVHEATATNGSTFLTGLDHWQTLIGSLAGAIIAIVGSMFIYWLQKKIDDLKQWKEWMRTIEISLSRSMDEAFTVKEQLKMTVALVEQTIDEVKKTSQGFAMQTMNFPISGDIYRNEKLPEFKVRSSYLHNKLMISDRVLKIANANISSCKKDFENLLQKNQFIVALEVGKPNPVYSNQRDAYAQSLTSFAEMLKIHLEVEIPQLIILLDQSRLYARKLNIDLKGTKNEYEPERVHEQSNDPLFFVDQVDEKMKKEVMADIELAKERVVKVLKN